MDKDTHTLMDKNITQSLLKVQLPRPHSRAPESLGTGPRGAKRYPPPPALSIPPRVVLEPSFEEHGLGLVCYLLEAISENPGIIKYTEIALL